MSEAPSRSHEATYALLGAAFGCLFPLGATLLQALLSPEGLSPRGIVEVQSMPLLWIIDSAPLFLGWFASMAGRRQDALRVVMRQLEDTNEELQRNARALRETNAALNEKNDALGTANDELVRASQLKSQFLANMSHELRTPLNAIIGFSRILIKKTEGQLPERQAKNLQMVYESGNHLLELVNDILDIERIEAGMLTVKDAHVDVASMASDVIDKLTPAAVDKSLTLTSALPVGELTLNVDPVRLRQVLDNLVNNAVKYSDQGTIELSIEVQPSEHPDQVLFHIRDEGIGIPPDMLPVVFDAFRQVDGSTTRAQGGVGLGLHLVRKIAQLLGGDVWAESEVGKGSIFTFALPASRIVKAERPLPADIDLAPQGSGPVLLIIDDTPSMVELLRTELVEAGFRVHAALSGAEGLRKAEAVRPDVILLDIVMPQMDGWAVLKELRRSPTLSATPVVITSQLDDSPQAYDLGILAWLTKPTSPDDFREVFDRIGLAQQADVLVVEDDHATASMVAQHLADLDLAVRCAFDGRQALDALADRLPRAVVLDLMLPELDGFTVLEHLRGLSHGAEVPVIVYSAKDLSRSERDRLSRGPVEVVGKRDKDSLEHVVEKVRTTLADNPPAAAPARHEAPA